MKKQPPRIRRIYTGDNLPILRSMNSDTVDLIYLDPPFNSGKQWSNPIEAKGKKALASFKDTWDLDDDHADHMHQMRRNCPEAADAIDVMGDINGVSWTAYLIYMGARLLEMRRILKPTGGIYYHCDPVMSHGVKLLMDSIFGRENFRNEVIWHYTNRLMRSGNHFARLNDTILWYSKSARYTYNPQADPDWTASNTQQRRLEKGWEVRKGDLLIYDREKFANSGVNPDDFKVVYWEAKANQPAVGNVWNIPILNPMAKERVGYPTQKPLALLERVVKASSSEGDLVLDPFCGCATTCIAAERLKRNWIGIDLSEEAAPLVLDRLREDVESPLADPDAAVEHLRKLPKRTDLERTDNQTIKPKLYKQQNYLCNGCQEKFELRNLEIDHVIDRNRGGQDEDVNLQLLCGACNREKGNRGMQYLQRKISDRMAREHRQKMELLRLKRLTLSDQQGKRD